MSMDQHIYYGVIFICTPEKIKITETKLGCSKCNKLKNQVGSGNFCNLCGTQIGYFEIEDLDFKQNIYEIHSMFENTLTIPYNLETVFKNKHVFILNENKIKDLKYPDENFFVPFSQFQKIVDIKNSKIETITTYLKTQYSNVEITFGLLNYWS